MRPVLFEVGGVAVPGFEAMLVLGFVAAATVAIAEGRRRGLDMSIAPLAAVAAMAGALAGARLHWALLRPADLAADPAATLLQGGVSAYGGFFGGFVALLFAFRLAKVPLGEAANAGAVALPVAYGIARVGCFLAGDDYGRPTSLPWGIAFPRGRPPTDVPVHPTQLYELLLMIPIFLFLRRERLRPRPPWHLLYQFWVLLGIERFAIALLRTDDPALLGLTSTQWISLGLVAAGTAGLLRARGRASPAVA